MSVPSLRALAFTALARHYAKLDDEEGNERKLMELLSELGVELIPELMRRRMLIEAIDYGKDAAINLLGACPQRHADMTFHLDMIHIEAETKRRKLDQPAVEPVVRCQYD